MLETLPRHSTEAATPTESPPLRQLKAELSCYSKRMSTTFEGTKSGTGKLLSRTYRPIDIIYKSLQALELFVQILSRSAQSLKTPSSSFGLFRKLSECSDKLDLDGLVQSSMHSTLSSQRLRILSLHGRRAQPSFLLAELFSRASQLVHSLQNGQVVVAVGLLTSCVATLPFVTIHVYFLLLSSA